MSIQKPAKRPANPCFSSGPCAKIPIFDLALLKNAALSRSHRATPGKTKLKAAIELTRDILGIPQEYKIGIVPASDTGAVEMALWSLLGARKATLLAWESFGAGWATDVVEQLKIDADVHTVGYGNIVDMSSIDYDTDVVFTWNGTTSGVRVPNGEWISDTREGLTLCDATSAAFAMELPWEKLDVTTYSWQKVLGGEAAHGMLILSPRAVVRLESYTPPWPLPKVFRLTKGGKLIDGIFRGETINTPSMLAVEDYLDTLKWAESLGGLGGLLGRVAENMGVLSAWVAASDWAAFLCEDAANLSTTSVCLKITDPDLLALDDAVQAACAKRIAALLEGEGVAYDISAYRDAPAGLRIWAGATIEAQDLAALVPWLDWAYATAKSEI